MKRFPILLLTALTLLSCSPKPHDATLSGALPAIYPDYVGVTVPVSIAPLDFTIKGAQALSVELAAPDGTLLRSAGKSSTCFSEKRWKKLLQKSAGDSIRVTVCGLMDGKWTRFEPFGIYVSEDAIDYGLTFRMLEPGYEVYSKMGIYERELSSFRQRALLENTRFDGCVNCHATRPGHPDTWSVHIRGDHSATLLSLDGDIQAYATKTDSTLGFCVYPYWHPSGRYITYSTNNTCQGFHVQPEKIIEVFDHDSDIQVYDVEKNELITAPQVKQPELLETFPVFTPDGRTIYFTCAAKVAIPSELPNSHYNLMKVSFDPQTGKIGEDVEMVIDAHSQGKSITLPRVSPDGKYLMYTVCDYGTFAIWHHESELWLLDLETGESRLMEEVNSEDTDSYHNWSSNGRWFVFTSRRDDGHYTQLYIAHFDENGIAGKPFMLPQRDPLNYYTDLFFSYNTPEFVTAPVKTDEIRAQKAINAPERVQFGFRWSD